MTDHPIIMSAPMVQALRAGRKTQTRRVMTRRNTMLDGWPWSREDWEERDWQWQDSWVDPGPSPSGNPGPYLKVPDKSQDTVHRVYPRIAHDDRMWVRETWSCLATGVWSIADARRNCAPGNIIFAADGARGVKWWPSIFLPREFSRTTLTVTAVRFEHLQDICRGDAIAEGLACVSKDGGRTWKYGIPDSDGEPGNDDHGWPWDEWETDPRRAFHKLWDRIHAGTDHIWKNNPLVIPYTFHVSDRNIDRVRSSRT